MSQKSKSKLFDILWSRPTKWIPKETKLSKGLKPISNTSKEFASSTTAHGFAYIVENDRPVVDRLFWGIVVILAISFTIFQMTTLYNQWQDDPVITTLETAALPIENIDFPAITICPQGSINQILSSVLFKQLKEYIIQMDDGLDLGNDTATQQRVAWNLTSNDMMRLTKSFLKDVYIFLPSQVVLLLHSCGISKSLLHISFRFLDLFLWFIILDL